MALPIDFARRIYPVPLKPHSSYSRWGSWPRDAEPMIRRMVKGFYRGPVFKCEDCEEFCEPHPNGIATMPDGSRLCDDCLIAMARARKTQA